MSNSWLIAKHDEIGNVENEQNQKSGRHRGKVGHDRATIVKGYG